MTNTTTKRGIVGLVLLAGALAAVLLVALSGVAGAHETRGVHLVLDKTVSPKTVHVGERQVFTIKIANHGTTRAERLRMADPLPSKVRFIRAATSRHVPGSCGIEDRVVRCRLGTLRPGRTVTVKIYVRTVAAGTYTNRAFVSFRSPSALGRGAPEISDTARAVAEL